MAEKPDSRDDVLPKSTRIFCAASDNARNRTGTLVAQKSTRSSFAARNCSVKAGTILKSMKSSCNAVSSIPNVCDNLRHTSGWEVNGLAKQQQTSSIDAKSTNRLLNAVCRLSYTTTSTCLASSVRASSSPQTSFVNRKCRKLPL